MLTHGGARSGAGRKKGTKGTGVHGLKKCLKVAGLRVPETATEEQRRLADWAQERIIKVAAGKVDPGVAHSVLKAASGLREEICGPLAQKHELGGAGGSPVIQFQILGITKEE